MLEVSLRNDPQTDSISKHPLFIWVPIFGNRYFKTFCYGRRICGSYLQFELICAWREKVTTGIWWELEIQRKQRTGRRETRYIFFAVDTIGWVNDMAKITVLAHTRRDTIRVHFRPAVRAASVSMRPTKVHWKKVVILHERTIGCPAQEFLGKHLDLRCPRFPLILDPHAKVITLCLSKGESGSLDRVV